MGCHSPTGQDNEEGIGSWHDAIRFSEVELEPLELPEKSRVPSLVSTKSSLFLKVGEDDLLLAPPPRAPTYSETPKKGEQIIRVESVSLRTRHKKLEGWYFGVAASACAAFVVLFVNVILTVYGATVFVSDNGIGTVFQGSCQRVNNSATWLHLLINALSSILLSASNYTMQCLYAPTRAEVDRAHKRGSWLDIGVPGMRNLVNISWVRLFLWALLALSTVPVHLLYNSAVFKTLDANNYDVMLVTEDFLNNGPGAAFTNTTNTNLAANNETVRFLQKLFTTDQAWKNKTQFEYLNNKDCIAAYSGSYINGRDHVLAITKDQASSGNETAFFFGSSDTGSVASNNKEWICVDDPPSTTQSQCNTSRHKKHASQWTIRHRAVEYCISHLQPSHCKLQFSTPIMVTVIICNLIKFLTMGYTVIKHKQKTTLVTIGDAVASYLDDPDYTTQGRCLMGKVDVYHGPLRWRRRGTRRPYTNPAPIEYHGPLVHRWRSAVSEARWVTTIGLCVVTLAVTGALLGLGVRGVRNNGVSKPFSLGFGNVDSRSLITFISATTGSRGLMTAVLLANLPQGVLSILYIMYNSLYTYMCLSDEWSKFATRRKPLRVTTPRGQQRSTYYLQLPYRYSVPLVIASAVLHWLVSQSIFLARVDVYNNGVEDMSSQISQTGFSNTPILCTIVLGTVMLLIAVAMGTRKFKSNVPVASSCSVSIAAACHRPRGDVDAAYLPIMWGEVSSEETDGVGHCCLTSKGVEILTNGKKYA